MDRCGCDKKTEKKAKEVSAKKANNKKSQRTESPSIDKR